MISADGGTNRSSCGFTRTSQMTTSAPWSNSAPRNVSKPASPGPAPTRYTVPLDFTCLIYLNVSGGQCKRWWPAEKHPTFNIERPTSNNRSNCKFCFAVVCEVGCGRRYKWKHLASSHGGLV